MKQYMNAKEFAATCGKPYNTIKRYCREGILRYERIGQTYSIDVEYALGALSQRTQTSVPQIRPRCRIRTQKDFLEALNEL